MKIYVTYKDDGGEGFDEKYWKSLTKAEAFIKEENKKNFIFTTTFYSIDTED